MVEVLAEHLKKSRLKPGRRPKRRIVVENVIRSIKILGMLSERDRNRRKRFSLLLNLIAGIYTYELDAR